MILLNKGMKMKKLFLVLLLTASSIFSQTQYRLNVNNINLPLDNKGILAAVNIPDPNPIIGGAGENLVDTFFYLVAVFYLQVMQMILFGLMVLHLRL